MTCQLMPDDDFVLVNEVEIDISTGPFDTVLVKFPPGTEGRVIMRKEDDLHVVVPIYGDDPYGRPVDEFRFRIAAADAACPYPESHAHP